MRLIDAFANMTDPRHPDMIRYPLVEVIAIALCAMLAGADDWVEVAAFGHAKAEWLASWLTLPHRIPAHDTFGRIFAWLDPQEFMQGFACWVQALQERLPVATAPEHPIRAIDGK